MSEQDDRLSFPSLLLDSIEEAVIATDLDGKILYWNRFAEKMYGWDAAEVLGRNILDVTPAEQSAAEAAGILNRLMAGQSWTGEIMLRNRDGVSFPAHITDSPLFDASGRIFGIVGVSHDISRRRAAERQSELVLAEQVHRLKNMLAMVQSLAHQAARHSSSTDEFLSTFSSRLSAVAAANELLIQRAGNPIALDELARATLDFLADIERVSFNGSKVMLDRRMILPFSMLLHELYTNAMKYGALSNSNGQVDVAWRTEEEEGRTLLDFEWRERGGPAVARPSKKGFGSALIERAIAQELQARISLDYDPAGVCCRLRTAL